MIYSENIAYLITIIGFIFSLQSMSSLRTYKRGIIFNILAIVISLIVIVYNINISNIYIVLLALIIGCVSGIIISVKVSMNQMPKLNNILHMFIGLSELLVIYSIYYHPSIYGIDFAGELTHLNLMFISISVVFSVFTGVGSLSILLTSLNIKPHGAKYLNRKAWWNSLILTVLVLLACLLSYFGSGIYLNLLVLIASLFIALIILFNIDIETPIITALINACSGWSLTCIGLILENILLITIGAIIGISGMVIVRVIAKSSNYKLFNIFFVKEKNGDREFTKYNLAANVISAEDAAFLMKNVKSIIIVPGYGVAIADAQNVLRELAERLMDSNIKVKFAVHRLAGRMPAHMNILLAEAGIDHKQIYEYEDIYQNFSQTDIVLVVGANDIVNPKLYNIGYNISMSGIEKAGAVIVINRTLGKGHSNIYNELFALNNVMTVSGDAKEVLTSIIDFLSPPGGNVIRKLIF
ncbi:NAD(P) transhydrogenase subunit beta [Rickettsiales bacterium Ac37b]|nr:NAD(P) transhydrogenase subunit beta [Rickettsiales bacterium Ac37b]